MTVNRYKANILKLALVKKNKKNGCLIPLPSTGITPMFLAIVLSFFLLIFLSLTLLTCVMTWLVSAARNYPENVLKPASCSSCPRAVKREMAICWQRALCEASVRVIEETDPPLVFIHTPNPSSRPSSSQSPAELRKNDRSHTADLLESPPKRR